MTDHNSREVKQASADIGLAALGAELGMDTAGSAGALLAATAPPVMKACLEWIRSDWTARRQENVASVIAYAVQLSALDPDDLPRRALGTEDKRDNHTNTEDSVGRRQNATVSRTRKILVYHCDN